jgi:peptide-methionine (S)-S-oxide reductase
MDKNTPSPSVQTTVLAGGCFWCLEAVFDQVLGVTDVVSGYAGGTSPNPTYDQVCSGRTGHAEVVRVTYDPSRISYTDILHIFFTIHDPTTLNRQGNDVGTQYRSAIFTTSPQEQAAAKDVIQDLTAQGLWSAPVVTQVLPLDTFYPAEDYHQQYFTRNPGQGYCQFVVAPKVAKFRQKYAHLLAK